MLAAQMGRMDKTMIATVPTDDCLSRGQAETNPCLWRVRQTESVCPYYLLFVYVVARIVLVTDGVYPRNANSGGYAL
jgi:hypothetical protein